MESGAEMSCLIAVRTSTLCGGGFACFRVACDCRLGPIDKSSAATLDPTSEEAPSRNIRRVDMSASGERLPLGALSIVGRILYTNRLARRFVRGCCLRDPLYGLRFRV